MWDAVFPYIAALLPTIGICFLGYRVFRAIVEGDRRERLAQSQWEAQQRHSSGGQPAGGAPSPPPEKSVTPPHSAPE